MGTEDKAGAILLISFPNKIMQRSYPRLIEGDHRFVQRDQCRHPIKTSNMEIFLHIPADHVTVFEPSQEETPKRSITPSTCTAGGRRISR